MKLKKCRLRSGLNQFIEEKWSICQYPIQLKLSAERLHFAEGNKRIIPRQDLQKVFNFLSFELNNIGFEYLLSFNSMGTLGRRDHRNIREKKGKPSSDGKICSKVLQTNEC